MAATVFEESNIQKAILTLGLPSMLCVINTVTAYAQALGRARDSLLITMLRNIILFIPCVIVLNALVGLKGAIAAQPVVETILAVICLAMYALSQKNDRKAE